MVLVCENEYHTCYLGVFMSYMLNIMRKKVTANPHIAVTLLIRPCCLDLPGVTIVPVCQVYRIERIGVKFQICMYVCILGSVELYIA